MLDRRAMVAMAADASEDGWPSSRASSFSSSPTAFTQASTAHGPPGPQAHASQSNGRPPSRPLALSPYGTSSLGQAGLAEAYEGATSEAIGQRLQDPVEASELGSGWVHALPSTSGGLLARGFSLPACVLEQGYNKEGLPRRPMNAYMIFARWRRMELKSEHCDLNTGDVSSLLSAEWKSLDSASKSVFTLASVNLKATFDARFPDYKYIRRPNGTRKRGSRGGKMYIPKGQQADDTLAAASQRLSIASPSVHPDSGPTRWLSYEEDELTSEQDGQEPGLIELAPMVEATTCLPMLQHWAGSAPSLPPYPRRISSAPSHRTISREARRIVSDPYIFSSASSRPSSRTDSLARPIQRQLPSHPDPIRIPAVPEMQSWSRTSPQHDVYPASAPYATDATFVDSQTSFHRPSATQSYTANASAPLASTDHLRQEQASYQLPPMSHHPQAYSSPPQQPHPQPQHSDPTNLTLALPSDPCWSDGRLQVGLGLGEVLEGDAGYASYAGAGWKGEDAAQWVAVNGRRASGSSSSGLRYRPQWEAIPEASPGLSEMSFGSVPLSSTRSSFSYPPPGPSRMLHPMTPSPTPYDPTGQRSWSIPSIDYQQMPPPPPHHRPHHDTTQSRDRHGSRASSSGLVSATSEPQTRSPQPQPFSTRYPPLTLPLPNQRDESGLIKTEWKPPGCTESSAAEPWSTPTPSSTMHAHSEHYGYYEVASWST